MYEPFKYVVQCVAIERDEQGNVVREMPAEPANTYNIDQIQALIQKFHEELANMNAGGSANGNGNGAGNQDHLRQSEVPRPSGLG